MNSKILIKFVKPLYKKKDKLHNFLHILKIKSNLKKLKPKKNLDQNKLEFILYFHGLKDYVKQNEFLITKKFDLSKSYLHALYRHTKNPKSIEEKLIHDANLLDNVGKAGLKKCTAYGKLIGRSKQDSIAYFKSAIKKVKFYTKQG